MSTAFFLTPQQMAKRALFFPLSHGVPRVDERRVISGIIYAIRYGLRWKGAPKAYDPHKTLYNRFVRWSRLCVFECMFDTLANQRQTPSRILIDATDVKSQRTAASLLQKGAVLYRTDSRMPELKTHVVRDGNRRPVWPRLDRGAAQDDDEGAHLLLEHEPAARRLADKGYEADWFGDGLGKRKIMACIPAGAKRSYRSVHDIRLYKQGRKMANIFRRLKEWRRIAMRQDRCALTFFSAICSAATVIFWLSLTSLEPRACMLCNICQLSSAVLLNNGIG